MKWTKLGLVYGPDGTLTWARSHAMIPTPFRLNRDVIRVFVTFRDSKGIGRPGYVDLSAKDPVSILGVSKQPLLDVGMPGTFDESGLLTCCVTDLGGGRIFMYYAGFDLGSTTRYRLLTGLAVSTDGGETFARHSAAPVLKRTAAESQIRGGPFCLHESNLFRLWYVAGSSWIDIRGRSMPVYNIRYMESGDGIHWPDEGLVQIPITEADEYGFGRPYVIPKSGGGYRMFYSVRRKSFNAYRLGYAESSDGYSWVRMDSALNLDVTPGSFDSDAIMYAAPIEISGKLYLFYNGNDFGRLGFAVARLEME
jgi:hypothetical protein